MKSIAQMFADETKSLPTARNGRPDPLETSRIKSEAHLRFWRPVADILDPRDRGAEAGAAAQTLFSRGQFTLSSHEIEESHQLLKKYLGVPRLSFSTWWLLRPMYRRLLEDALTHDDVDLVACAVREFVRLELGQAPDPEYGRVGECTTREVLNDESWCQETPAELAGRINEGVASCCEQTSGSRRSANFGCSDVISVDIDGTRRIPDVLADSIAQKHLTIFYTTPSHTEAEHRFRLIFALPRPIQTAREMVAATRSLSLRLSGDRAATDAARIFYGSRGSNPLVFDRAIDDAFLDELIAQGLDADQNDARSLASTVSRLSISPDLVVRRGTGETVPFGSLGAKVSIHCPFHADTNASAFTVRSTQGGVIGIRCSTCWQTFWPDSSLRSYDFFDFDRRVTEAHEYFEANKDMGGIHDFLTDEDNPIRKGLLSSNVAISQTDYLSLPAKLPEGIIFIKSPKGTGKTERLRKIIADDDGSVLLIGHRVALIKQSCERLGLECYLDIVGPLTTDRLGVCLDSLRRLRLGGGRSSQFKTIIIDESEQVLSHFLSDTIDSEKRDAIFVDFKTLLHAGLIRARADHFKMDKRSEDNFNIPKEFWWAEGHKALKQNWEAGDFDTWIDHTHHLRAFGVSFFRADIEKLIPPESAAQPVLPSPPSPAAGGRPPADWWEDLLIEICFQHFRGDLKPKVQADIERAMQEWITTKGYEAASSTVRTRARKVWQAIKSEADN